MKKLMKRSFILSVLIIMILEMSIYAYENDVYKLEVPDTYEKSEFSNSAIFTKSSSGKANTILVYVKPAYGLKRDINAMTKSQIDELVSLLVDKSSQTEELVEQKKEKLAKSKAIKVRIKRNEKNDISYMDMYITVSDKHIVLVAFMAQDISDLDSIEYKNIKDSFILKEKTTNVTILKVVGIILVIGVITLILKKRAKVNKET